MFFRKPKHYSGLDHSGPCHVCPPTFQGVKALVEKVGYVAAVASVPQSDHDNEDLSHDLVREFLGELQFADKVERQTLISDFSKYVKSLESSMSSAPAPSSPDAKAQGGAEGEAPADAKASAGAET